jgi:hypothetical protein
VFRDFLRFLGGRPSNKSKISSGNGASKSSGIFILSRKIPSFSRGPRRGQKNKTGYGNTAIRDGDFFSGSHAAQQSRELRFRFVYSHYIHNNILDLGTGLRLP